MAKENPEIMLNHMSTHFKSTLTKCEGKKYDCQLFVSIYLNLKEAVEEFCSMDIKSPIISVGFYDAYHAKFNELRELKESLERRGMI
jgi:hypothetical protein